MSSDVAPLAVDDRVVAVRVGSLRLGESPRLAGMDAGHVRLLSEVFSGLPPIVVHRGTMRVVDGVHRVRAAMLRGEESIDARFFEGGEGAAFVVSVRENTAHGLPLSLADRKAAAARIMADFPEWSDRVIAGMTGLSHSTVGAIRKRSTAGGGGQPVSRVGRDGRVRPVDFGGARRRARELIVARPEASVRQVAKQARVSVGTAQAMRQQVNRARPDTGLSVGEPREPSGRPDRPRVAAGGRGGAERVDWEVVRRQLRSDPALRYSESGRRLLQWLESRAIGAQGWAEIAELVPPRWSGILARLARRYSREWQDFARALHDRADTPNHNRATS